MLMVTVKAGLGHIAKLCDSNLCIVYFNQLGLVVLAQLVYINLFLASL